MTPLEHKADGETSSTLDGGVATIRLSVVIPYFRAAGTIGVQLEALANQRISEPWEVVISDNESSDELKKVVRPFATRLPNLRVVDASGRRGAGHARNVGVEAARGRVIVMCDADDEVGQGWLAAMNDALSVHDFVACRIDPKKLNPPWTQRIFGDHPQQWGLMRAPYPLDFPNAAGGTLGFKRSVYESVGGFEESFPFLTDTEFCYRVHVAGTELHFVPDAVVHYRCRTTLSGLFKQAHGWAENWVRLYRRYRPHDTRVSNPWKHYITEWDSLLRSAAELRSQETRGSWVWQFGWKIGQLRGSIRYFTAPF